MVDHQSPEIPAHIAAFFEHAPVPMSIYDRTGLQIAQNLATAAVWNIRREEWIGRFNMLTDPQLVANGSREQFARVMQGETVILPPHPFVGSATGLQDDAGGERWSEAIYFPIRDASGEITHLGAILRDVTVEIAQRKAMLAQQAEIANQQAEIASQQAEIANQQAIIETLSSPVVQVWPGILTVPLVGTIDSRRAIQITENLLTAIGEEHAECVILDITGVPIVDTQVAQYLIQTALACKLLGCDVVLVGISVEMAQTLVQLGVDLRSIVTLADLQAGIAWAFARRQLRVVAT